MNDEIIICQGLLRHSRLMRQSDDNAFLAVYAFLNFKSENDAATDFFQYKFLTNINAYADRIVYTFTPFINTPLIRSLIFKRVSQDGAERDNLLIINLKGDTARQQLRNGSLTIYYA